MESLGENVPVWVILVLVAVLLLCVYTYRMSRHQWVFKKLGIPGPPPVLLFGNMGDMTTKGVGEFDLEGLRKYGKVFGSSDMFKSYITVADKDMLRDILVKKFTNFTDRRNMDPDSLHGDMAYAVSALKGEKWHHARNVISPTFSSGKLRKMIPLITEACDMLVKTVQQHLSDGDGQVEMRRLFGGYTMDVIGSTAFGIHLDSQSNPDDKFVMHATKLFDFESFNLRLILLMFFPALKHFWVKMGASIFPRDSMVYFRTLIQQLVDERKRSKGDHKDFLQLMIKANVGEEDLSEGDDSTSKPKTSKGLTFNEIVGNAEVFFVAGYETTAVTLTMASYNLAMNPEYQDKLRQEIEEEIGSAELNYENIQRLQYMDMCISETLRMYPPLPRYDRVCKQTTVIKGVTIPAGMIIAIPAYAIHHDPAIWENPEAFRPERFSPAEKAGHDPLDYMPFGYGPRACVGTRLAIIEVKMALARVVRKFQLSVGNKTDIPPKMHKLAILKPVYLWLKVDEIDCGDV